MMEVTNTQIVQRQQQEAKPDLNNLGVQPGTMPPPPPPPTQQNGQIIETRVKAEPHVQSRVVKDVRAYEVEVVILRDYDEKLNHDTGFHMIIRDQIRNLYQGILKSDQIGIAIKNVKLYPLHMKCDTLKILRKVCLVELLIQHIIYDGSPDIDFIIMKMTLYNQLRTGILGKWTCTLSGFTFNTADMKYCLVVPRPEPIDPKPVTVTKSETVTTSKPKTRKPRTYSKRKTTVTPKPRNITPETEKCPYCSKEMHKNSMKGHIRTHTGEKPYTCVVCGVGYALSGNLKKHMLIHEGVKPYECPICGRAFRHQPRLKYHIGTHKKRIQEPDHRSFINKSQASND